MYVVDDIFALIEENVLYITADYRQANTDQFKYAFESW